MKFVTRELLVVLFIYLFIYLLTRVKYKMSVTYGGSKVTWRNFIKIKLWVEHLND